MDTAARIREKIDLVVLISEYVPLRKMGRNFKANCPFHSEKTPSFVVSPERQIWHCFGCGKGGDCFSFIMEYEQIEFVEALKMLGKRTGIEVEFSPLEKGISSQKENIYRMNKLAASFYHYILTKHNAGKKTLEYVEKIRKIKPKVIETFCLGFSPSTANALSKYLMEKKGFKKQELIDAGLSTLRNGVLVDFFFNRLMFPLSDHRGNIVGFSGRVVSDTSSSSKYVNTRETLVYHKGDVFFGLNIAKDEIKKEGSALIMEGEFDVISSFQEGFGNAVAVKGTALTQNQVNLISRFCQKVILCFDQDAAGFEALRRSLALLEKKSLSTYVLSLSNGKDPDESIRNHPALFKKSVQHPVGVYDFLLEKMTAVFDRKTMEGKKKLSEELLPVLGSIENEIVKEYYLEKFASVVEVSLESIYRQMEKVQKKEDGFVGGETQKDPRDRREILEQYLLALVLQSNEPRVMFDQVHPIFSESAFYTPSLKKLFFLLADYFEKNRTWETGLFIKQIPQELLGAFDSCYLLPIPKFANNQKYQKDLEKILTQLREIQVRGKIKDVSEKLKKKEIEGTSAEKELEGLQKELSRYLSLLS